MQVGARVRVEPNCRAARLVGKTGQVVSLGRQVELQLDGEEKQLAKVNRNEVVLVDAAASTTPGANKVRGGVAPLAPAPAAPPLAQRTAAAERAAASQATAQRHATATEGGRRREPRSAHTSGH